MRPAAIFHSDRLRAVGLGHYFNVISNGYGSMPEYSAQVIPADRWAIAAYIRALQLSQSAQRSDVASGASVQPLASIAEAKGLPDSFAEEWKLPSTATYGTPGNQDNGVPGQEAGASPKGTMKTTAPPTTGQAPAASGTEPTK